MEKFVRLLAPRSKVHFVLELAALLLICGAINHLRHALTYGFPMDKTYWTSFYEAGFTALPMCALALLMVGHLNTLQKRLYLQATRDHLTGLPNRRWFLAKTPRQIGPDGRLMIIDIDHFKRINDQFGHDVGDTCLQRMAEHLRDVLGAKPKFARIGGEEFAVFWDMADLHVLQRAAQSISDGFEFTAAKGIAVQVTASVGIAAHPMGLARSDAMILADRATYEAKARGRANYVMMQEAA